MEQPKFHVVGTENVAAPWGLHEINLPQPDVVQEMERLLEEARRGAIKGFVCATVDGADLTETNIVQGRARSSTLVAAAALLSWKMTRRWGESH